MKRFSVIAFVIVVNCVDVVAGTSRNFRSNVFFDECLPERPDINSGLLIFVGSFFRKCNANEGNTSTLFNSWHRTNICHAKYAHFFLLSAPLLLCERFPHEDAGIPQDANITSCSLLP